MLKPVLVTLALASPLAFVTPPERSQDAGSGSVFDRETVLALRQNPEYDRQIFFAVLEGLYADGVKNDVVDSILRIDEKGAYPMHFVWQCPICMPTFNALRSYRKRDDFAGTKIRHDTFGGGLSEEVRAAVLSDDLETRLVAIEALTKRWLAARMNALRLTPEERAAWRDEMARRRKLGMKFLLSNADRKMDACAFCDGANEAGD